MGDVEIHQVTVLLCASSVTHTHWTLSNSARIYYYAHTFVTVVMATLPLNFTVDDTAGTRHDSIQHSVNLALGLQSQTVKPNKSIRLRLME